MHKINPIIHQPIRLQILTMLHMDKSLSFSRIKKELGLSDGNLGTHLEKLEQHAYIKIKKTFASKKPLSTVSIETLGEKELGKYMTSIESIFRSIK